MSLFITMTVAEVEELQAKIVHLEVVAGLLQKTIDVTDLRIEVLKESIDSMDRTIGYMKETIESKDSVIQSLEARLALRDQTLDRHGLTFAS